MTVLIDLDTTPPHLGFLAVGHVDPPDDWSITITSSEDIGPVRLDFIDALSEHHAVGFVIVNARTLVATVATALVPGGSAELKATVADLAYNVAVKSFPVFVDRPVPYWVTSNMEHVMSVSGDLGSSLDVDSDVVHVLDVEEGIAHSYDVSSSMHHILDVEEGLSAE